MLIQFRYSPFLGLKMRSHLPRQGQSNKVYIPGARQHNRVLSYAASDKLFYLLKLSRTWKRNQKIKKALKPTNSNSVKVITNKTAQAEMNPIVGERSIGNTLTHGISQAADRVYKKEEDFIGYSESKKE